jgi:hypothetical protein
MGVHSLVAFLANMQVQRDGRLTAGDLNTS